MTHASVDNDIHATHIWREMSLGTKLAAGMVAIALLGASLAASLILAGAALFSGIVMLFYGALSGKHEWAQRAAPLASEPSPPDPSPAEPSTAKTSPSSSDDLRDDSQQQSSNQ